MAQVMLMVWLVVCGWSVVYGASPSRTPTRTPTRLPTRAPTRSQSRVPTPIPSRPPTRVPTRRSTPVPTSLPTSKPTSRPTSKPNSRPSAIPTGRPSSIPTAHPSTHSSHPSSTHRPTNFRDFDVLFTARFTLSFTTADDFNDAFAIDSIVLAKAIDDVLPAVTSYQDVVVYLAVDRDDDDTGLNNVFFVSFTITLRNVLTSGYTSAQQAYQETLSALQTAVNSGTMTVRVQVRAALSGTSSSSLSSAAVQAMTAPQSVPAYNTMPSKVQMIGGGDDRHDPPRQTVVALAAVLAALGLPLLGILVYAGYTRLNAMGSENAPADAVINPIGSMVVPTEHTVSREDSAVVPELYTAQPQSDRPAAAADGEDGLSLRALKLALDSGDPVVAVAAPSAPPALESSESAV